MFFIRNESPHLFYATLCSIYSNSSGSVICYPKPWSFATFQLIVIIRHPWLVNVSLNCQSAKLITISVRMFLFGFVNRTTNDSLQRNCQPSHNVDNDSLWTKKMYIRRNVWTPWNFFCWYSLYHIINILFT